MRHLKRLTLAVTAGVAIALSSPAFGADGGLVDDGCAVDWAKRLDGQTFFSVSSWGTRIEEYFVANTNTSGRVYWHDPDLNAVFNDGWEVKDCDKLCWTLEAYDDWCSFMRADGDMHTYSNEENTRVVWRALAARSGDPFDLIGRSAN